MGSMPWNSTSYVQCVHKNHALTHSMNTCYLHVLTHVLLMGRMMTGSRTLSSASKGGTSQPAKSINKGMGEYEKAIIFSYSHAFFIVINSS